LDWADVMSSFVFLGWTVSLWGKRGNRKCRI